MKNPTTIFNRVDDANGLAKLKAGILCEKLVEGGVNFFFEKVGDCYTVTVAERDVKVAVYYMHN